MGAEFASYAFGDVIPGSYDVIQKTGRARQRPAARVQSAVTAKGASGRSKLGAKLLTFAMGTLTAFAIPGAIPGVRASGLLRAGVGLGLAAIGAQVGSRIPGAPGTWGYGVAFGGALATSYEGWSLLSDIERKLGSIWGYPEGFVPASGASPIWNYGSIVYTP